MFLPNEWASIFPFLNSLSDIMYVHLLNFLILYIFLHIFWTYWFTGEIDSAKTVFLRFHSTIVLKAGFYHSIAIEPKDNYGNPAAIDQSKLDIEIRKVRHSNIYHLCLEDVYSNLHYRTVLRGLWLIQSFLLIETLLPNMNCT